MPEGIYNVNVIVSDSQNKKPASKSASKRGGLIERTGDETRFGEACKREDQHNN